MRFISFFLSCKPLIADKQERHLWYDLPVTSVCVAVFAITISSSCVSRLCLTSFFSPTNATFPSRRHFFTRQLLFFSCSFFAQIPDLSRRWKCLVNAMTVSRGEAVRSEWPLHRRVNGPSVSSLVRSACISAQVREKTKQVQQLQCEVCLTQTRSVAEHSQHTTNSTPALLE